jgi:MFS family permease
VNLAYSNADVSPRSAEHIAELAYRKVTRRTIPLLFACYVMAHLDRNNIGYAQLQMKVDLAFSDAIYGLGAGIFFLGYILFEVPSNLLLVKVGVRKTLLLAPTRPCVNLYCAAHCHSSCCYLFAYPAHTSGRWAGDCPLSWP